MKAAAARLHILLAQEGRYGLVIRHGTAKSVFTLLWDRKKDRFTLGQWLRGIHLPGWIFMRGASKRVVWNRLVWTAGGCLWTGKLGLKSIVNPQQIHDFDGM
jgi:hypothetical protein